MKKLTILAVLLALALFIVPSALADTVNITCSGISTTDGATLKYYPSTLNNTFDDKTFGNTVDFGAFSINPKGVLPQAGDAFSLSLKLSDGAYTETVLVSGVVVSLNNGLYIQWNDAIFKDASGNWVTIELTDTSVSSGVVKGKLLKNGINGSNVAEPGMALLLVPGLLFVGAARRRFHL